jgi:3-deoxy-7-phosphoheptulonate synthase
MIVAMQETATEDQIQVVTEHLIEMGFSVHRTTGERQTILAAVGARSDFDTRNLEVLSGVMEVHRISAPYKLAGRSFRPQGTIIEFKNGVKVGGKEVIVMAGPCSVESRSPNRLQKPALAPCVAAHSSHALRRTHSKALASTL